jgi:anti-anti-sigma regulatory factor
MSNARPDVEEQAEGHSARVLELPRVTALRDGGSTVVERTTRGWKVLSTGSTLSAGGTAEDFEQRVQRLVRDGHRRLVADVKCLTKLDSSGIAALCRSHAAVQLAGETFRVAAAPEHALRALREAGLDRLLSPADSIEVATPRANAWQDVALGASLLAVTGALVSIGHWGWPGATPAEQAAGDTNHGGWALAELVQLVAAALIGVLVTAVQRRQLRDRPMTRSMEQAQVLLCVSGAMTMIIIGSSLARAFGIAGAAGIIRFRTPVDDPKDVTILFLLMGLGMACGIGALPVAGVGALFLCVGLVALDRSAATRPRMMHVKVAATGREFPASAVAAVFARHAIVVEPREVVQGEDATVSYAAAVPTGASIEHATAALAACDARVASVEWNSPKRG